jgi:hypothetical protein
VDILDKVAGKAKVGVAVFVIMVGFSHTGAGFRQAFHHSKFLLHRTKNNLTTAKNAVK